MSALSSRDRIARIAALMLVAGGVGFAIARLAPTRASGPAAAAGSSQKPLYFYDPMVPTQHFDKPGKSPFMDMQLVPRYAESDGGGGGDANSGVRIDPASVQNLGVRLASVEQGSLDQSVDATGVLDFDQRDVAVIQSRAAGFVQRVYARAPGDVIGAGAPIADILIPTWGGAQDEYLAVRLTGDASLAAAARQRLHLLGMPETLIAAVARDGRRHDTVTIRTPIGGAIQTLDVRQGMTVALGQTLAQVSGLSTLWLNAAVPEALAGQVRQGDLARADFAAFPGAPITGRVAAILPSLQADSRTLTVRVAIPNSGGRLRPGMYAAVHLLGASTPGLFVPSEAVIQTGTRALVMLARPNGAFQPTQVRLGRQSGDRTEILAGLTQGQKVVASGQFLLDSEASLNGVKATPLAAEPMTPAELRR